MTHSLRFAPTHAYRQAAAASRIVGKDNVIEAAKSGNLELVKDHILADAGCVHKTDGSGTYGSLLRAGAAPQHMFPVLFQFVILQHEDCADLVVC